MKKQLKLQKCIYFTRVPISPNKLGFFQSTHSTSAFSCISQMLSLDIPSGDHYQKSTCSNRLSAEDNLPESEGFLKRNIFPQNPNPDQCHLWSLGDNKKEGEKISYKIEQEASIGGGHKIKFELTISKYVTT